MRWSSVVCLILLVPRPASGRTVRVPQQQPTIQDGIEAASNGDTVLVGTGTFTGPGNRDITFLGKAIVVRSERGAPHTTIDCEANADDPHRGFLFSQGEGPDAVLDGFTIVRGYMSTAPSRPRRAALHDLSGGGIKCQVASPTIRNCVIRSCGSEYTGGGISIEVVSAPTVTNCTIQGCTAGFWGGGISIETASTPTIAACVVTGNRSPTGGGISCQADGRIAECVVSGNAADRGGGFEVIYPASAVVERSIVWGNCAPASGGEVFVDTLASLDLACNLIDAARLVTRHGTIRWLADNAALDPLFCAPSSCTLAPAVGGDYRPQPGSPALPANSPCGQRIGALSAGCDPETPVDRATWGRLKSAFR